MLTYIELSFEDDVDVTVVEEAVVVLLVVVAVIIVLFSFADGKECFSRIFGFIPNGSDCDFDFIATI